MMIEEAEETSKEIMIEEEEASSMISESQRSHSPMQHAPIFPAARIKRLVKLDKGGASTVSAEALNMISRATECFVEAMARSAGAVASVGGRRTVNLKDLAEAVRRDDRFQFTHDLVPMAIPFEEAVRNQQDPIKPKSKSFFSSNHSGV